VPLRTWYTRLRRHPAAQALHRAVVHQGALDRLRRGVAA